MTPRLTPAEHGIVRRTALVNRLRAAHAHPVAVIVAPVGFGKTTLLEQWADRDDRRFLWLMPGADAEAEAVLATEPAVVVVDDAHLLEPTELSAVARLVRLAGDGSMVVLAGQTEPRIPSLSIPALRARGELLELGAADLALTWREARLAVQALGSTMSEAEITDLVEQTEGWPAAVNLAGSGLGVAGLQAECLASVTRAQRTFLRRTSVLDRFDRSLCDAVLGHTPGTRELQPIDDLNAFLVPLDRRRQWFRCHRLLRDVLRAELEAEEPELAPILHRRAADWLEEHGQAERAMDHAHAAGDVARFMGIFTRSALPAHNQGRDVTVDGWIRRVDETEALERYPDAATLAARLHAHRGRALQAAHCLAAADRALSARPHIPDPEPITARIALVHAATGAAKPAGMLAATEAALEHLPADDPWRPWALLLQGVARMLLEDTGAADHAFDLAAHSAEQLDATETWTIALTERALLADARGDHAAADTLLARIGESGERVERFGSYALSLAASARSLLRHGRWSEARRSLTSAQRLLPDLSGALPWLAVQTRLELAAAHVMLRDAVAARKLLDEADGIFAVHPKLGLPRGRRDALEVELSSMPAARRGAPSG